MKHIEVENLSVSYGDFIALKKLDFEAEQGEFVAIVGISGSGKSTFLKTLAGLTPFKGKIKIPQKVGIVFQHYAVFPWLTVKENISFGLEDSQKFKIIQEYLKLTQLEDKKDKYPGELSGGQVQRVALARSLAHNPEVLLMDEPYAAMDVYTRDAMHQWLLQVWQKEKKTTILVTHNIEEAIYLSDRVLILENGGFISEIKVSFAYPRRESLKFSPEFNILKHKIYSLIKKST